jgi:geranyl-CoA carboxylase beta subunit
MNDFRSRLDTQSQDYADNRADMLALVDTLSDLRSKAEALSEKRRPRFEERGQLTPRERLQRLLDPGMPLLELYGLANYLVSNPDREQSIAGASLLAGIGFISGVRCLVMADDSGISAGAATPTTGEKIEACLDVALRH